MEKQEQLTFEQAMEKLTGIVSRLESGSLPLDELEALQGYDGEQAVRRWIASASTASIPPIFPLARKSWRGR